MKKKVIVGILVLLGLYALFFIGVKLYYGESYTSLVSQLEGEVYYLKRVDGNLALFKSQANMENEELLYSHAGKGDTGSGFNDNITDFHLDEETGVITFIAMYEGEWTEFEYNKGNVTRKGPEDEKDIIGPSYEEVIVKDTRAYIDQGSIYVTRNNETIRLKDVGSNYDQNYNTYLVLEISPDGRYLIYCDSRNSIFRGILDMFLPGKINNKYVIDLETKKVSTYIDTMDIVWIQ